ncbi:hypothetical protein E1301_Tti013169 [Triplophysa tibetana]|uniref:Ig-like domain-containing protein n=1 Tax=Triplophysa tibetana TaxID=1572043 RepID=A0A5A9PC22_9TELE|nr:hypothetical protein E1301_Tti013169 [Triplophysa tibetana]
MRNLKTNQNGEFYCFVETFEGSKTTYEGRLEIKNASLDVSVVSSSVSGDEGGNVSVKCLYSSAYKNEHKQWCRYKDKRCYTSQNSSLQISDDERESFTVLMSGLMLSDSGWYYCSVQNFQAPVQLTVTAVTIDNNTETINETRSSEGSGESTLNKQQKEKSISLWLPVSAGLLMIILVAACAWKWKNRSKEDKKQINKNSPETATVRPEEPVICSTINDENPNDISLLDSKANTIYSSIEDLPECEAQSPAGGTVYSTVAPH